jgi:Holliday junction resolvase-like predicted endonuclease
MKNKRAYGISFERLAEEHLIASNYSVIERNWYYHRVGELDLICRDNDGWIVFVEVRVRSELKGNTKIISYAKHRRLLTLSRIWLIHNKIDERKQKWRIDLLFYESDVKNWIHYQALRYCNQMN